MRISDWSSDVCSSDLFRGNFQPSRHRNLNLANGLLGRRRMCAAIFEIGNIGDPAIVLVRPEQVDVIMGAHGVIIYSPLLSKLGRSSCRDREGQYVSISVVPVYLKITTTIHLNT